MKLIPYSFQIVARCQVVDDKGKVIGEEPVGRLADPARPVGPDNPVLPVEVWGVAGLQEWAAGFSKQLDAINRHAS